MTAAHSFFTKVDDLNPFGVSFRLSLGEEYDEKNKGRGQRYAGSFLEAPKRSLLGWETDLLDEVEGLIQVEREKILIKEKTHRLALVKALKSESKDQILKSLDNLPNKLSESLMNDVREMLYKHRKLLRNIRVEVDDLLLHRVKLANTAREYRIYSNTLMSLAKNHEDILNILSVEKRFQIPEPMRLFFWKNFCEN